MEAWDLQPARDHGMPLGKRLSSLQRESGLISTGLHVTCWTVLRAYLSLWHRLKIVGRANLPAAPPYILVANHSSHLDALVLAAPLPWRLRDCVFPIAAGDVFFETPLIKAFSAFFLNAMPMWRKKCGSHALQELRERLDIDPCIYVLFPEGTRSRDGMMAPFKKGLGILAAGMKAPVVPCYLDGCHSALPPGQKWPRRRHITLHIGIPLDFSGVPNDRAGWEQVSREAESAVRTLAGFAPAEPVAGSST